MLVDILSMRTNPETPSGWPGGKCPASWLSHPEIVAASVIYDSSMTSALANWPDTYAHWLSDAVNSLRRQSESKAMEALQNGRQ